jgi:hypothetical protein
VRSVPPSLVGNGRIRFGSEIREGHSSVPAPLRRGALFGAWATKSPGWAAGALRSSNLRRSSLPIALQRGPGALVVRPQRGDSQAGRAPATHFATQLDGRGCRRSGPERHQRWLRRKSRNGSPFARQVRARRSRFLRMRFLVMGHVLAPRTVWPRRLSVGRCPTNSITCSAASMGTSQPGLHRATCECTLASRATAAFRGIHQTGRALPGTPENRYHFDGSSGKSGFARCANAAGGAAWTSQPEASRRHGC